MPLIKTCDLDAFYKNLKTEIDAGKDRSQAFAIAINVLKKACGVETDEKMSPEEIVAKGESNEICLSDLIQEGRKLLGESRSRQVRKVNKLIAKMDKTIGLTKEPQSWKTVKDAFNVIVNEFGRPDAIYAMGSKDGKRVFELDGGVNLVWMIHTFDTGRVELTAYAS